MSNLFIQLVKNRTTRLLLLVFLFFSGMAALFLVYTYNREVSALMLTQNKRNESIAKTVSTQIDCDSLEFLMTENQEKDAIVNSLENDKYRAIHAVLREAQKINKLKTPIYTLVKKNKAFHYGVVSSKNPFFRHVYKKPPPELFSNYETGGNIGPYLTENGKWLSYFIPLRNSKKVVISLLEVDVEFNVFIAKARTETLNRILYVFILILIVGLVFFKIMLVMLRKEQKTIDFMNKQKNLIQEKNSDITASIEYARKIQKAILPGEHVLNQHFKEAALFFAPRDIVSGDFHWLYEDGNKNKILVVADCTGHGVPGAFMSLIGSSLLNEIIKEYGILDPSEMLCKLNELLFKSLHTEKSEKSESDGMDCSIICINADSTELKFSGAQRPMYFIRNGELTETKGSKFPIGDDAHFSNKNFETFTFNLLPNDRIFLFTDGYADQFGGEFGKKMMTSQFKSKLIETAQIGLNEQMDVLKRHFKIWKNTNDQVDDVLLVGIEI